MKYLENTKCNTCKQESFKKVYLLAAALYFSLLSTISHIPGSALANLGFSIWDKAAHFLAYSIIGVLLQLGIHDRLKGKILSVVWVSAIVGTIGLADEFHQMFVSGRSSSMGDVAADFLGGLFGSLFIWFFKKYLAQRQLRKNLES